MVFSLLYFMVVFLGVYFTYYFIFDDMLKKEKYTKISELGLLVRKFNLDKKKMDYRQCLNGIAIINAFIIGFTISLIEYLAINIVFKLMIAFIIMIFMILALYYLYGKHCQKKWGKKNGV